MPILPQAARGVNPRDRPLGDLRDRMTTARPSPERRSRLFQTSPLGTDWCRSPGRKRDCSQGDPPRQPPSSNSPRTGRSDPSRAGLLWPGFGCCDDPPTLGAARGHWLFKELPAPDAPWRRTADCSRAGSPCQPPVRDQGQSISNGIADGPPPLSAMVFQPRAQPPNSF